MIHHVFTPFFSDYKYYTLGVLALHVWRVQISDATNPYLGRTLHTIAWHLALSLIDQVEHGLHARAQDESVSATCQEGKFWNLMKKHLTSESATPFFFKSSGKRDAPAASTLPPFIWQPVRVRTSWLVTPGKLEEGISAKRKYLGTLQRNYLRTSLKTRPGRSHPQPWLQGSTPGQAPMQRLQLRGSVL
jgi:hypothetical protein